MAIGVAALLVQPCAPAAARAAAVAAANEAASPFETLYPGVYTEKEKAGLAKYWAEVAAINARGPVDVAALVSGKLTGRPGINSIVVADPAWVAYDNAKYDPDNKVYNDADYARSLGYKDMLAFPTFAANDDAIIQPYPSGGTDTLLAADLNHEITSYRPIYPGDTLYLVINHREIKDLTPQGGSIYRYLAFTSSGSIYNQHGEKVQDVIFRNFRGLRIYKPGLAPEHPTFKDIWDSPDWRQRKPHVYTDADWETIKGLWRGEHRQGAAPLYWEDVKIGDRPTWTADGPVEKSVAPVAPWGMGSGGSRTIRHELLGDVKPAPQIVRETNTGIYVTHRRDIQIPPVPALPQGLVPQPDAPKTEDAVINTADIHEEGDNRSILINYMGREYAIRHINNWMGDHGWIRNIRWGILNPKAFALNGKTIPGHPDARRFLSHVPGMEGRFVSTHGMTEDLAIVKSYVYDKYVLNGQYVVDLAWWIENLDGDIWEAGGATVALPSRLDGKADPVADAVRGLDSEPPVPAAAS
ncbi:hypothetical protein HT136_19140 [Novosphingobium profundi]|uniref:MaoC family dehydratase N-terminal domain-containing protein n=1 Tax=Novosphingobium profundi TaxID=1774954 RepID=UPI001BD9F428|nr:MaoC family dehydratase N-terminal domain-containing protein [Novosphingobium profundi]MBT0670487.1 hypothetical protein [Novosphingobium profundi]